MASGKEGRIRRLIGRVALTGTVALGFLSVIFSRDFGGVRVPTHHPESDSDKGIAYADAANCTNGGDSSGGSDCDSDGGGGGG